MKVTTDGVMLTIERRDFEAKKQRKRRRLLNIIIMRKRLIAIAALAVCIAAGAQQQYEINVESGRPSGIIDEMLYGQLFEHIYFSANNGVWQELIYERSFEPEHFPGIPPRDGYFDGWFMDDEGVLHSPTRYEQPLSITEIGSDDYEITMEVNWRSFKLARRAWSGGLMDIRFAFRNKEDGAPYYFRIHDPYYETRTFTPAQTESQIAAADEARARQAVQAQTSTANFSISVMAEREAGVGGRTRRVSTFEPLVTAAADKSQVNEERDWHKLRISCNGNTVKVYWDDKEVLSYNELEKSGKNDLVFWVNYTEALYRNIRVTSANGRRVYFEGTPKDVQIPDVAQQWTGFGPGKFSLVKGDAVNMDYSQRIESGAERSGVFQGPQNVVKGEKFVGSVYAKGDGRLSVALRREDGSFVAFKLLGPVTKEWKKYDFTLESESYVGPADFAICVQEGAIQIDQATMSTQRGLDAGGFRPDILQAVKELHPTCLRWPGGGYVAQYNWKWGIGPQEERIRWPHWMWMDYDQNCFGTDEFIRFCREINSEPVIVVRVGFDRPESEHEGILQDALDWLRYCNEPATGEWGAKRAANGHPAPYNVKYWEIDNEMWEMGIVKYEAAVRKFSTEMRKIDPSIKIIACGGFQEDEEFINRSGSYFDYMSLHHYEQQGGYATGPARLGQQYDRYAQMIAKSPNPNIKLFISEWNLNSIDWRTGLFAGGFLNVCEARDIVAMGAAALFIRRTDAPDWNNAFINFDYKDLFKAPNCQVTELWYNHFSKYRLAYTGETGNLSISTTLSENGANVIVKVVNPTNEAATLRIKGDWPAIEGAEFEYYAPGSLTVANSMEQKDAVALKRSSLKPSGNDIVLEVPSLSAGVLTIAKKFD